MKVLASCIAVLCLFIFISNFEHSDLAIAWAVALVGWAGLALAKE